MRTNLPLYLKVDDYKAVMENMEFIKRKISETDSYIKELNDVAEREKELTDNWDALLGSVDEKIKDIERSFLSQQFL